MFGRSGLATPPFSAADGPNGLHSPLSIWGRWGGQMLEYSVTRTYGRIDHLPGPLRPRIVLLLRNGQHRRQWQCLHVGSQVQKEPPLVILCRGSEATESSARRLLRSTPTTVAGGGTVGVDDQTKILGP